MALNRQPNRTSAEVPSGKISQRCIYNIFTDTVNNSEERKLGNEKRCQERKAEAFQNCLS